MSSSISIFALLPHLPSSATKRPIAPLFFSNDKSDRTSPHQQRKERSHLSSSVTKRAIAPLLINPLINPPENFRHNICVKQCLVQLFD
ncbi:MAG: hypothetical protein M3O33_00150 [Cyanobacteriota bacterium]|nr:hypothetical protein [Cyanobacteriota bacterium]